MFWILGYGCTSSAGSSTSDYWQSLRVGKDHSEELATESWSIQPLNKLRGYTWSLNEDRRNMKSLLVKQLHIAWNDALMGLSSHEQKALDANRLGVIFASTKGNVEDWIWNSSASAQSDNLGEVLKLFIETSSLTPLRHLCISNSCASALSAIFLAQNWLRQEIVDDVLILAADAVGPFVSHGFNCLHALTQDRIRPFANNRTGLSLGDAAAAILLSRRAPSGSRLQLSNVGLDVEGHALTRPESSGLSLQRAILQISELSQARPDLVIAHGTATEFNDATEDRALSEIFGPGKAPQVTATKWCIGHTLGASGAMDLIAACESLRRQEVFAIGNTYEVDSNFQCQYVLQSNLPTDNHPLRSVLLTSLGFGGVHAAAIVRLAQ